MKKIVFSIIILLSLGCISAKPTSLESADIRGNVTRIILAPQNTEGILLRILIEGEIEKDTKFDKATVTVTEDTHVFQQTGKDYESTSFAYLEVGQKVQVKFTGPVMESYPVQATANEIVILEG